MGIIVIGGQSNAAGRGTVPLIPAAYSSYADAFAPVQLRYKTEDEPTEPLVWDFDEGPADMEPIPSGNGTFGIELSLGRRLHSLGIPTTIAKMAIGSSSLAQHWGVGADYPLDPAVKLYQQFIDFCSDAETELSDEVAAVCWIHGETDGNNPTHAGNYATNLRDLIEEFRGSFPGVPWYLNRLHIDCGSTHVSTIRDAQDLVAATVPGVVVFDVDDLTLIGAHYDTPSFIALGFRFADQIAGVRAAGIGVGMGAGPRSGLRCGLRCGLQARAAMAQTANFPPIASFTYEDTALEVAFTDTSQDLEGAVSSWLWDFGDGNTSTSQNPTHSYDEAGEYTVALTVTDAGGLSDTTSQDIEVEATAWAVDETSGIACPETEAEWDDFIAANSLTANGSPLPAPDNVWLLQDASGPLADAYGGKNLTVTGVPLFQQTESGWARKFISSDTGAAGANRFVENGSMAANTSPVLLLVYARVTTPVSSHQRFFYGQASHNAAEAVAGSNVIRYRTNASAANGSLNHTGQVRPFLILHDTSGSGRMGVFSDIEKVSPAYAARSGSGVRMTLSLVTDSTSNTIVGYAAAWSGAAIGGITDGELKAILEAANWTVTGW